MTHEEIVDILDILYIKLMRLKTAHRTCLSLILSPEIESRYPDIVYSIKYSFAVDAYTTLNAMLTSGTYSFQTLQKHDTSLLLPKCINSNGKNLLTASITTSYWERAQINWE